MESNKIANVIQKTQMTYREKCTSSIELSIVTQQSTPVSVTLQPVSENAAMSITTPFQPVHYYFFQKQSSENSFAHARVFGSGPFHGFIMMFLVTVCCVSFTRGRMQNFAWRTSGIKMIILLHHDSRTGNMLWKS